MLTQQKHSDKPPGSHSSLYFREAGFSCTSAECLLIREPRKFRNHLKTASPCLPTLRWRPSGQERNLAQVAGAWCLETGNACLDSNPAGEVTGVRRACMLHVWSPTQGWLQDYSGLRSSPRWMPVSSGDEGFQAVPLCHSIKEYLLYRLHPRK